jgi:hypothetical protein
MSNIVYHFKRKEEKRPGKGQISQKLNISEKGGIVK